MSHSHPQPDNWNPTTYRASASFVPALTTKILSHLSLQPADTILDLGSGDGLLTAQIARLCPSGHVLGLDSSPSFIASAQKTHAGPNCTFRLQDCRHLSQCPEVRTGGWGKVFSNAALHWILRPEGIRETFFRDVYAALAPGGVFVFEMGGAGNVAEVVAACTAMLMHFGLPPQEARAATPWFFPSETQIRGLLEGAGFEVEVCESEYRPTRLTEGEGGGLEGWVRLMCAEFLAKVPEGRREEGVRFLVEVLEGTVGRGEGEGRWLGYCRLRAVGRKR